MHRTPTKVLFVSKENAFRSLLAEACLTHLGCAKFQAFSCGVPGQTAAEPNHWALLALKTVGIPHSGLHCKDWHSFTHSRAPLLDFVISLDLKSFKKQPAWPGQPESAIWEYEPIGSKKGELNSGVAAIQTLHSLRRRLELLVSLHSRAGHKSDLRHDIRDMAHL